MRSRTEANSRGRLSKLCGTHVQWCVHGSDYPRYDGVLSTSPTAKLYQIEHPRLVSRFDEVAAVADDEDGFHISKAWLKGNPVSSADDTTTDSPLAQTGD